MYDSKGFSCPQVRNFMRKRVEDFFLLIATIADVKFSLLVGKSDERRESIEVEWHSRASLR
ncbi:hypothetical protein [Rossellomorea marisflavi]|uniref:hypothetical protein n=1 Tax=Rossellomorea marisflavi TaxID=189381 RepID=UPI0035159372